MLIVNVAACDVTTQIVLILENYPHTERDILSETFTSLTLITSELNEDAVDAEENARNKVWCSLAENLCCS